VVAWQVNGQLGETLLEGRDRWLAALRAAGRAARAVGGAEAAGRNVSYVLQHAPDGSLLVPRRPAAPPPRRPAAPPPRARGQAGGG